MKDTVSLAFLAGVGLIEDSYSPVCNFRRQSLFCDKSC